MYNKVYLLSLLCLNLSNLFQPAWSRSVSVSLNMSMTRNEVEDRNQTTTASPKITRELLQSCMRETEISMSQLKLFRLSLLFNENSNNDPELDMATGNVDDNLKNDNNVADIDYDSTVQLPSLDLKRNEPLHCFVRCLYDGLGLIHYEMVFEEAFKMEVQSLLQRQKPDLTECQDIRSTNRCEAAYKLRLCYNHLKNLEAEQRLREVLERSETSSDTLPDNEELDANEKDEKTNEVINGIQETAAA
ncbi:uncharacterized protein LOC117566788 [Drosophila albomicans]|uniref:Uncharacterized protein LOC117566788 n=1 Tax=Drosophila albomicans TaxID=7291 RepID=A0A6P8WF10_DROAB|nr:uncharacterized protein LOC117566788 [Drosophila albomicans]